jgi:drug/metabolite transporter (DMT)-like permease
VTKAKPNSWLFPYLGTGIVWGASFLFISMSIQSLSPVGVAFWRMTLGAAPIAIVAVLKRLHWPKTAAVWLRLLVVSLCMNAIPSILFSYAEQHVSSALAGIINAATPITTVLVILIYD